MLISPVPDQDRTGHLDLVPGRRSVAAHCSWLSLGEDARMGKGREDLPPISPHCMCVCVCVCVCHLCVISACRVAIKRTKCPLISISISILI